MFKVVFSFLFFQICFFSYGNNFRNDKIFNIKNSVLEISQKEQSWEKTTLTFEDEIKIFKKAYPSVKFESSFDYEVNDYKIDITSFKKTQTFYWANGLYLPKAELLNKEKYWKVITPYSNKILDPKNFSEEQIAGIKNFSSSRNRKNGRISSKAIFNVIYDSSTRASTERHIVSTTFLGKSLNIHEYIKNPLKRAEKKILALSKKNVAVKKFIDELGSCSSYNWREIRDSATRSFHSYGIAVDILPKKWGSKIIYWGYEKEKNKEWMLIPIEKRWMPPKEVRDIFLEEGFIWGGTWAIWDNMHFEYHPELVLNYINDLTKKSNVISKAFYKDFLSENKNILLANYSDSTLESTKEKNILDNDVIGNILGKNYRIKNNALIKEYAVEYFIIDFLVIIALYCFLIFCLNRKQKMFLFLSLICLNSLITVIAVDNLIIGSFLSDEVLRRVKVIGFTLVMPLYNLYTESLYDTKVKSNRILIYINFFLSACLFFVPYSFLLKIEISFLIWFSLMAIYQVAFSAYHIKKDKKMFILNTFIVCGFFVVSTVLMFCYQNSVVILKISIALFDFVQLFVAGFRRDTLESKVQSSLKKYERLNFSYSKFISKQILKYLQVEDFKKINFNKSLIYEGMILVVRIINFVEIEKKLKTEDFVKMLTHFYEVVALSAKKNGGFLSQFVGDEIIGIFEEKNDSVCKSALCVSREAKRITKDFLSVFGCSLEIEIGINVGKVCFGFTGNEGYSCLILCSEDIDKTVELAKTNAQFGSNILITEKALDFCRTYADCLFEGVIHHVDDVDIPLYKVIEYDNELVEEE